MELSEDETLQKQAKQYKHCLRNTLPLYKKILFELPVDTT